MASDQLKTIVVPSGSSESESATINDLVRFAVIKYLQLTSLPRRQEMQR